jgi:hypothetical protein
LNVNSNFPLLIPFRPDTTNFLASLTWQTSFIMAPKLSLYASLLDPEQKAAEESAKEAEAASKKQSVNAGRAHES